MNEAEIKQEIARLQAVLKNQKRAQTDEITEHVNRARTLTPSLTKVTQPAFEELLEGFEKLYLTLKRKGVI